MKRSARRTFAVLILLTLAFAAAPEVHAGVSWWRTAPTSTSALGEAPTQAGSPWYVSPLTYLLAFFA